MMEFGYWGIRGLGAAGRMMFAYADVEHADVQYTDPVAWFGQRKPELIQKNPMVNLPYVVDGEVVITHSNAVLEYLGDKLGIDGFKDDGEKYANAQCLAEVYDLRNALMQVVYPFHRFTRSAEEFEETCPVHLSQKLPAHLTKLEAWMAMRGTKFLVRDASPTSADFHAFEMLDQHEEIAKRRGAASPLASFPKLRAFYDEFKGLPQLAKYFASSSYTLPMNSQGAQAWIF
jgi:glutathione S-transferase